MARAAAASRCQKPCPCQIASGRHQGPPVRERVPTAAPSANSPTIENRWGWRPTNTKTMAPIDSTPWAGSATTGASIISATPEKATGQNRVRLVSVSMTQISTQPMVRS